MVNNTILKVQKMFVPDSIIHSIVAEPQWHISICPLLISFKEHTIAITDVEQYLYSLLLQRALMESLNEVN